MCESNSVHNKSIVKAKISEKIIFWEKKNKYSLKNSSKGLSCLILDVHHSPFLFRCPLWLQINKSGLGFTCWLVKTNYSAFKHVFPSFFCHILVELLAYFCWIKVQLVLRLILYIICRIPLLNNSAVFYFNMLYYELVNDYWIYNGLYSR